MATNPYKWQEEDYVKQITMMRDWFKVNLNAIYFKEYYLDDETIPSRIIPWNSLRQMHQQHASAVELWSEIVSIQELRIMKWTITGRIKSPAFGQFLLKCQHKYTETVRQEIEVTSKDLKFKFGNDIEQPQTDETED